MKIPFCKLVATTALGSLLTACAPDTINNIGAKGFNAYLNTLQTRCNDFYIGNYDIHTWLQSNGAHGGDAYDTWLDTTSRLYYNRISTSQYRSDLESSLGQGTHNAQSFACIAHYLPASRPDRPESGLLP